MGDSAPDQETTYKPDDQRNVAPEHLHSRDPSQKPDAQVAAQVTTPAASIHPIA